MRISPIAGVILSTILSTSAEAQRPVCMARPDLLEHLAERYGEVPVAFGITNSGGLVEVLATYDGATWTIIVTSPQGTACIVAAGEGWRRMLNLPEPNLGPRT